MRIFIFWIVFLASFCAFSQVLDDFSDGDFTAGPAWTGEVGKFKVDSKKQLHLADEGKTGNARLAVASTLVQDAEWSFYVHLQFNPSANNYALFYLTATEPDFSGEGYCIRIGGAEDNVSLLRYRGEQMTELIKGIPSRLNLSSPAVRAKVSCTAAGQWTLHTFVQEQDADFVLEGTANDNMIMQSAYAGVRCIYTSSRSTSFVFDDVFIRQGGGTDPEEPEDPEKPEEPETPDVPDGDPDDRTPPRLLSASAVSNHAVALCFDEAVLLSGFSCLLDGQKTPISRKQEDAGKRLLLTFDVSFTDMQTYTLELAGIRDRVGNVLADSQIQFTYYDPSLHTLEFGEVVFSELMVNPVTVAGLPESEYIELFNKAAYPVSLKGWTFHYGNRKVALKDGTLPAQGYAVLCHEKNIGLWKQTAVSPIGVASFPELANSGKLLWLTDARNNLIAWVEYTDRWYADDFKRKGGFSLECVDMTNQANDSINWQASTDPSGGTPERDNSVKGICPDESLPRVEYAYLETPDTVVVRFSKPMLPASLAIADNYTVLSGGMSVKAASPSVPDAREVTVALSDTVSMGYELELELQHLEDISGYSLEGNTRLQLGLPEAAMAGDLLINEVLFDSCSEGTDYVELYNASSKYIGLDRLLLTGRDADGRLGEGALLCDLSRTIAPGMYLCFPKRVAGITEKYVFALDRLIELRKLPSMPDDEGNVLLVDRSGGVIDSLYYTKKMHAAFLRETEGVALEKINPSLPSNVKTHWTSASEASGGGTPGMVNSQYRKLGEEYVEEFVVEQQVFTPDGDGVDDELLVAYRLEEDGVMATARIYDSAGRLVYSLAENELLAAEGVWAWDGRTADGLLTEVGIYVVYIETIAPSGKQKRHKLACVRSE